jgi:hypothetical protein
LSARLARPTSFCFGTPQRHLPLIHVRAVGEVVPCSPHRAPQSTKAAYHSAPRLAHVATHKQSPSVTIPYRGGLMANLARLSAFVSELKSTRTNLVNELRHVDAALSVLGKLGVGSNHTKPKHSFSASTRKRMSLAQRARWAKAKGRAPKPKRTISAAGKRRIAAAQRARWAKVKAGKKKAA